MDGLPDLGYTSPKRWYDDAFLQDADTSGSGNAVNAPTQSQQEATGQSGSESVSGNIGVAATSPNSQTEPVQKRPKLDSSDSDVDVTSISMPTCINEPVQACSSSQSVTQSDMSSNANKQTLTGSDTKSGPASVESKTEEKELSKQETSTDSKSDKDGNTGQDTSKNKKEKLEDEQTKMKLVCKVVSRS